LKKILISISLLFLIPVLSGCASWQTDNSIKAQNKRFMIAISRYEFLRHKGIPIINPKIKTKTHSPVAGIAATKALVPVTPKSKILTKPAMVVNYKKLKPAAPQQSVIVGKTNGLPVLTVNFVNKPLWQVLQSISNKTGYVFSTKHINLGKKITLKGRYNFADILAKIFNGKNDNVSVNVKTKRVKSWQ